MNIVVVDDDYDIVEMIASMLELRGTKVIEAGSGAEAIEKIIDLEERRERVDLIIMDIEMPEMDGLETCRRIMKDCVSYKIPVIFFSGNKYYEDVVKQEMPTSSRFISKPFAMNDFMKMVFDYVAG